LFGSSLSRIGLAYQSNPAVKIATSNFWFAYLRKSIANGLIENSVLNISPVCVSTNSIGINGVAFYFV